MIEGEDKDYIHTQLQKGHALIRKRTKQFTKAVESVNTRLDEQEGAIEEAAKEINRLREDIYLELKAIRAEMNGPLQAMKEDIQQLQTDVRENRESIDENRRERRADIIRIEDAITVGFDCLRKSVIEESQRTLRNALIVIGVITAAIVSLLIFNLGLIFTHISP